MCRYEFVMLQGSNFTALLTVEFCAYMAILCLPLLAQKLCAYAINTESLITQNKQCAEAENPRLPIKYAYSKQITFLLYM